MTTRVLVGALVVSAALAAGCGSTHTTKGGARRPSERTIHIPYSASDRGAFTPIFHGKQPFVPGDSYIVWGELPRYGFGSVYCVIVSQAPRRTFWCTRTFVFAKGQIVAAGAYDNAPNGDDGTIPIVGGTGPYEGARGTVTTRVGRGGSLTIRLR
jgi:hypothetical protein